MPSYEKNELTIALNITVWTLDIVVSRLSSILDKITAKTIF